MLRDWLYAKVNQITERFSVTDSWSKGWRICGSVSWNTLPVLYETDQLCRTSGLYDSDSILCDGRELVLLWPTGKFSLSYFLRLWLHFNYCQRRIINIISLLLNKSKTFSRSTWLTVIQGPLRSDMDMQVLFLFIHHVKRYSTEALDQSKLVDHSIKKPHLSNCV